MKHFIWLLLLSMFVFLLITNITFCCSFLYDPNVILTATQRSSVIPKYGSTSGFNEYSDGTLLSPPSPRHLLADAEGLAVEVLDELAGHVVRVVGVAVHTLLLQEVNFHRHGAYTMFGLVKLVVCYYKGIQTQWMVSFFIIKQPHLEYYWRLIIPLQRVAIHNTCFPLGFHENTSSFLPLSNWNLSRIHFFVWPLGGTGISWRTNIRHIMKNCSCRNELHRVEFKGRKAKHNKKLKRINELEETAK